MPNMPLIDANLGAPPGQLNQIINVLNGKVDKTLTINGFNLYRDIVLTFADIGGATAAQITYDPSGNVIITATDVQGALDQVDAAFEAGAGKAIRGTVLVYSLLPTASAHTDELWAVTNGEGTIWINRKDKGVYRSDGSTWLMVADLTLYDLASEIGNDSSVSGASTKDALNTLLGMFAGYVPTTRTVNGHALSSNVTVTASDVGLGNVENAAASALYVPLTRTVNTKALSTNITLTPSDIGSPSGSGTSTGTNTGDQTITLTGAVTGSGTGSFATTLATVNSNVGTFGSSTSIPTITVSAKGLVTAASGNVVIAPAGTLTGATLASGVTASSLTSVGTLANLTVTNPITGSVTGNAATVTTNANLTGAVTSVGNATSLGSFTSAQLATALTDETGSGANVFASGPTLALNVTVGATTGAANQVLINTNLNGGLYITSSNSSGAAITMQATAGSGRAIQFYSSQNGNFGVYDALKGCTPFRIFGGSTQTAGALITTSANSVFGFTSDGAFADSGNPDTSMTRISAGVVGFGTGAAASVAADVQAGNIKCMAAGKGFYVKEGTNACMGIATLVGGTVTVSTTKVTANSRIFLTRQTTAGTLGSSVDVTARNAGTDFTITSNGSVLDTSTVAWEIKEPA